MLNIELVTLVIQEPDITTTPRMIIHQPSL